MAELKRRGVNIPAPGGNELSFWADKKNHMDRYVHLCLNNEHPMEWTARQDGRIVQSVFLEVSSLILESQGVLFSPEVSNKTDAVFYKVADCAAMIDYDVLYTRTDWTDPIIKERRKAAHRCEMLIPTCVPMQFIKNFPNG